MQAVYDQLQTGTSAERTIGGAGPDRVPTCLGEHLRRTVGIPGKRAGLQDTARQRGRDR